MIQSPEVPTDVFSKGMAYLQANFGDDCPTEKLSVLFEMIREDGWSEARFRAVLSWFLKSKKFATWTIADWFEYRIRLYPESWYHKQCSGGYNPLPNLDRYRLSDGSIGYKLKDGVEIPGLEKLPDYEKEK